MNLIVSQRVAFALLAEMEAALGEQLNFAANTALGGPVRADGSAMWEIQGKPVAEYLYTKSLVTGPGEWVKLKHGYPLYVSTAPPVEPKLFEPAKGVPLPTGTADKPVDFSSAPLTPAPAGSIAAIWDAFEVAKARLATKLKEEGLV